MRMALVHDWLTGVRGGEKCLDVLCRSHPDAELFTLLHRRGATTSAIERMRIHTSPLQTVPAVSRVYRYLLPLMPAAVESLQMPQDLDLVVSFSHAVAKGIIPPANTPHVCYCFTPMRYAWCLRDNYFEQPSTGWLRALASQPVGHLRNYFLDRLCAWDRAASDRVTHFVAISRTIQRRIREHYGRDSVVIFPPVDVKFYCPADVVRDDAYVCISALVPYKRIELAIQACNRLKRRLFIVGSGPMRRQLEQQAGPTVTFLGWRSNEEIRALLRCSRALIFPAHEDFGIVPVEAQACGCPVIAFAKGGATETIIPPNSSRPGTGLFFPKQAVESVCDAMLELERHGDSVCANRARQQALRFSTERFEHELTNFLRNVVASARESPGQGDPAADLASVPQLTPAA